MQQTAIEEDIEAHVRKYLIDNNIDIFENEDWKNYSFNILISTGDFNSLNVCINGSDLTELQYKKLVAYNAGCELNLPTRVIVPYYFNDLIELQIFNWFMEGGRDPDNIFSMESAGCLFKHVEDKDDLCPYIVITNL